MIATYHNHSTWSDGKASLSELVDVAASMGVHTLGVSDHYLAACEGELPGWALPPEGLEEYLREIRALDGTKNVQMRAGLEIDWFPEHRDAIAALLDRIELDYVIGSVHYVGSFPIDGSPQAWQGLSKDECDAMNRAYWRQMHAMAASELFDIIAHIDLPKKFAFYPSIDLSPEIDAALEAIAESGAVVELNTAGWHKPCADAYPSLDILRRCHEREIAVTISSDSHKAEDLVRDFHAAAERLREAGYDRITRFARRKIMFEPLEDAVRGLPETAFTTQRDEF